MRIMVPCANLILLFDIDAGLNLFAVLISAQNYFQVECGEIAWFQAT